jgi:hypothetical protein
VRRRYPGAIRADFRRRAARLQPQRARAAKAAELARPCFSALLPKRSTEPYSKSLRCCRPRATRIGSIPRPGGSSGNGWPQIASLVTGGGTGASARPTLPLVAAGDVKKPNGKI